MTDALRLRDAERDIRTGLKSVKSLKQLKRNLCTSV
jgi:hypothetical protein